MPRAAFEVPDYVRCISEEKQNDGAIEANNAAKVSNDAGDCSSGAASEQAQKEQHSFEEVGRYRGPVPSLSEKDFIRSKDIVTHMICDWCEKILTNPVELPECKHRVCRFDCKKRFNKSKVRPLEAFGALVNECRQHRYCKYALGYSSKKKAVVVDPKSCKFKGHGAKLAKHESVCRHKVMSCSTCYKQSWEKDTEVHKEVCKSTCPNWSCRMVVLSKDMAKHKQEECLEADIDCPMAKEGCSKIVKRRDMGEHEKKCPYAKVQDKLSELSEAKAEIERLKRMLETSTPEKVKEEPVGKRLRSVTKQETM